MGLFSNIRDRIRSRSKRAEPELSPEEILHSVIDDELEEDSDLEAIWVDMAEDAGILDSVDQAQQFADLNLDANVMELFLAGWVNFEGEDSETVVAAREEFFEIMSEYNISEDNFDWDAWRDWYKGD